MEMIVTLNVFAYARIKEFVGLSGDISGLLFWGKQ